MAHYLLTDSDGWLLSSAFLGEFQRELAPDRPPVAVVGQRLSVIRRAGEGSRDPRGPHFTPLIKIGQNPAAAGVMCTSELTWPMRLFKVAKLSPDPALLRMSKMATAVDVLAELPIDRLFGPHGHNVAALIGGLAGLAPEQWIRVGLTNNAVFGHGAKMELSPGKQVALAPWVTAQLAATAEGLRPVRRDEIDLAVMLATSVTKPARLKADEMLHGPTTFGDWPSARSAYMGAVHAIALGPAVPPKVFELATAALRTVLELPELPAAPAVKRTALKTEPVPLGPDPSRYWFHTATLGPESTGPSLG
ncbi:MAG: hypothetical protein M0Z91_10025 [Actinomycetota bacterium]|nr:hypothetical protein [Actinomycetota bacterium]